MTVGNAGACKKEKNQGTSCSNSGERLSIDIMVDPKTKHSEKSFALFSFVWEFLAVASFLAAIVSTS